MSRLYIVWFLVGNGGMETINYWDFVGSTAFPHSLLSTRQLGIYV